MVSFQTFPDQQLHCCFSLQLSHHHCPSAHSTFLLSCMTNFAKQCISTIWSGLQHLGTLSWLEAQWVSQSAVISPEMEHQRSNLSVLVPKARPSLAALQKRTTYTAEVHPSCNSFHPNKIQSWETTQLA